MNCTLEEKGRERDTRAMERQNKREQRIAYKRQDGEVGKAS